MFKNLPQELQTEVMVYLQTDNFIGAKKLVEQYFIQNEVVVH
jgi:hypothetical protein